MDKIIVKEVIVPRKWRSDLREYVVNNVTYCPPVEIGRFDNHASAERAAHKARQEQKPKPKPLMSEPEFHSFLLVEAKKGVFDDRIKDLVEVRVSFELMNHMQKNYYGLGYGGEYFWCGIKLNLKPHSQAKGITIL